MKNTLQNQYFPANAERMDVHCLESGCIGKYIPLGPRDCPRASPSGNLSGLGVQNPRPREISRASGDVFPNTSLLSAVYGYNKSSLTEGSRQKKIGDLTIKLSPSKGLLPLAAEIVLTYLGNQLTITAPHQRCAHDKDQLFISH